MFADVTDKPTKRLRLGVAQALRPAGFELAWGISRKTVRSRKDKEGSD